MQDEKKIRDVINVNCIPMAVLSSYLIGRMKKREKGGAIFNLSSYSCVYPLPYMAVYAATKGFNDIFSQACSREKNNVDILSIRAMKVLSGKVTGGKSLRVPTSR